FILMLRTVREGTIKYPLNDRNLKKWSFKCYTLSKVIMIAYWQNVIILNMLYFVISLVAYLDHDSGFELFNIILFCPVSYYSVMQIWTVITSGVIIFYSI